MADLFDMQLRARRRDRAARLGPELFLFERVFEDCLERISLTARSFEKALMIGCPDAGWRERLERHARHVEVRDPGPSFAAAADGSTIVEDDWNPEPRSFDLVLAIGTLDSVNALPLALRLIRHAMRPDGLLIGAMSGGDTLPQLRNAMRAADAVAGGAAPHVHPRIEASALAPLLSDGGFAMPVVDIERVPVSYASFLKLVRDLRGMAATNVLSARPAALGRRALDAAAQEFAKASVNRRTTETFEILHFAAWSAPNA
ncbi:MAG TPA: methyltransferase domain-containing protein [Sphingomicrobium sp.]|nr:methyltransferase domain-containing protein [Sphingomicrobium sp.]